VEIEFFRYGDKGREVLQVVAHIDYNFILINVEIIISHPKAGCLGLVSIEKNAGEWRQVSNGSSAAAGMAHRSIAIRAKSQTTCRTDS
jgi:hypothetical protein